MSSSYCTVSDLYSYGLPRGGLANPARLAERASSAGDTITLDQHGFATGDPLQFRADAGGSLPAPLAEETIYYAIRVTDNVLKVSATSGGLAIDLTTSGAGVLVLSDLPTSAAIMWASEIINDMLPAHVVPLVSPYAPIVVMTCAELAVGKLQSRQGGAAVDLSATVAEAQKRLARWGRGVPVRGENAPPRHNLAANASRGYADAKGWRSDSTI